MKQYKIKHNTNNNTYNITVITTTYFFNVKMGELPTYFDNLTESQAQALEELLKINEYDETE